MIWYAIIAVIVMAVSCLVLTNYLRKLALAARDKTIKRNEGQSYVRYDPNEAYRNVWSHQNHWYIIVVGMSMAWPIALMLSPIVGIVVGVVLLVRKYQKEDEV